MLSDYKRYLLKIRNSLIRCGVELEIKDTQNYEEVFYLGEKLSDLLWFYSVLQISGSEDRLRGFMFPLNSFYKSSLRDEYFEDYLIYRAGYMEISASDALMRSNIKDNKKINTEKVETPIQSTLSFIQNLQSNYNTPIEEDEFLNEDTNEENYDFGKWGKTDYSENDDSYSNWGGFDDSISDEDDVFVSYFNSSENNNESPSLEDDEFISYNSEDNNVDDEDDEKYDLEDDEFISYSSEDSNIDDEKYDLEDDEFISYNSEDNNVDDEDDDAFGSWGSSDYEENETYYEENIEDDDTFGSWGNVEEDDFIEQDSSIGEGSYENDFSNWGSDEEDDFIENSVNIEEDDEDMFSSWGSPDEDYDSYNSLENDEDDEDDEDAFGSWGSSEEDSDFEEIDNEEGSDEEDVFGNWGTSEESTSEYEDHEGSDFGSWGDTLDTPNSSMSNTKNGQNPSSKKSKIDYEIESNEKTAKVIEKIAMGIFSKGNLFKSKVSEKIKNLDENQD